jgi:alpha-D-ribose 1-methylphosphonate 5-triphosphate synthase subunit PhnH
LPVPRRPRPASPAAGALILTLCDGTTPLHLAPSHDSEALRGWITFHTGAPLVAAEAAAFAIGTWEALQPVDRFAIGTAEYPDRAATLIVEMPALEATGARLTGPGIETEARCRCPRPPPSRRTARGFPLGFDCFFTSGDRVAGLPRSTRVTEG